MAVCCRYAGTQEDAEDMLQEGFIRVFDAIGQFRGDGSLEGWIKRVMINAALYHIAKSKKSVIGNHQELGANHTETGVEPDAVSRLSSSEIIQLVSVLPPAYRTVFNLSVMDGFNHSEISQMLGISESTSRSNLAKARSILKNKINKLTEVYHGQSKL